MNRKQFVSIILILLIIFTAMFSVSADDLYKHETEIRFSDLGVVSSDEFELDLGPVKDSCFYSYSGSVSGVNFSSQLSGNSLVVYEQLGTMDSHTKSLSISLKNKVTFVSDTASPTSDELKPVYNEIKRFTQMAIDAYSRDYPENYWLDIDNSVYNFKYTGKNVSGKYHWTIDTLTYTPAVKSIYAASLSGHDYQLNKAVRDFVVSGSTTYEKVKSIYTQVCKMTEYKDYKFCYDSYGPLVAGYGVCSGYAKAFKLLCDRENIPCVLVSGISYDNEGKKTTHMWNLVRMKDGKWYCVDTTWADSDTIIYDYLLTGSNVKLRAQNNRTFAEAHVANGDFSDTGYFSFKYPDISKTAYDSSWVEPTDTPAPTATPIPTATPVPVENPEPGDANRDGKINAQDALIVLKIAAKILDNSEGYYDYGDMQNDGIFTAEDALLILKLSAKIS